MEQSDESQPENEMTKILGRLQSWEQALTKLRLFEIQEIEFPENPEPYFYILGQAVNFVIWTALGLRTDVVSDLDAMASCTSLEV